MKKILISITTLILLCACDSNTTSTEDIYSHITNEEETAIFDSFESNKDCLYDWLYQYYPNFDGLEMRIVSVRAAEKRDAFQIATNTGRCFGDTYAHGVFEIVDGEYVDKSYLNQRVFLVTIPLSNYAIMDLYFDKYYDFIPTPPSIEDECWCDCWK